jgi:hypothetical protein
MSDPHIVRGDTPHEVSMPEGSNAAVSKTGEAGAPSIRRVLAEPEQFDAVQPLQDARVFGPAPLPTRLDPLEVPPPVSPQPRGEWTAAQVTQAENDFVSAAGDEMKAKLEAEIGGADQTWVEMDFPARVIKLKMENDRVRDQLDHLERLADNSRKNA